MSIPPCYAHAVAYARRGWPVIPLHSPVAGGGCSCGSSDCRTPGKHPRTVNGLKDSSTAEEQIKAWWSQWPDANVGIVTGPAAGIWVLDIDPDKGGADSLRDLERTYGPLPHTIEVVTGGLGRHIYFGYPNSGRVVKSTAGVVADGIDTRGVGGMIVAPPSRHASGRSYEWEVCSDPDDTPLEATPEWLLTILQAETRHAGSAPAPLPGKVVDGQRNQLLLTTAGALRARGLEPAEIEAALLAMNALRCDPPLAESRVRKMAASTRNWEAGELTGLNAADPAGPVRVPTALQDRIDLLDLDDLEATVAALPDLYEAIATTDASTVQPILIDRLATKLKPIKITRRAVSHGVTKARAKVAAEARRSQPVTSDAFLRGDDVEIAKRMLADLSGARQEIVHTQGELWRYNLTTGLFDIIEEHVQGQVIHRYAGSPVVGRQCLSITNARVEGAKRRAADMVAQPHFFNTESGGIAFRNGFVTVSKSGAEMHAHSPSNRCRWALPWDYAPLATAPRFLRYLQEIFERDQDAREKSLVLQEFVGGALFGIVTRYRKALVLYGPRAQNGKSQFLRVLTELFGKNLFASVSPHQFGDENHLADLAGKRINLVNELPSTDIQEAEIFKGVITGDPFTVRRVYQRRPFTFNPIAGHVFACNNLPGTSDKGDGFWSRFNVITFNRVFAPGSAEVDLGATIAASPHEMQGVAAWAVDGAVRLLSQSRFTELPSGEDAIEGWKEDADPVRAFLREETTWPVTTEDHWTDANTLYLRYRDWCPANGYKQLNKSHFGRRLSSIGIESKHQNRGAVYPISLTAYSRS